MRDDTDTRFSALTKGFSVTPPEKFRLPPDRNRRVRCNDWFEGPFQRRNVLGPFHGSRERNAAPQRRQILPHLPKYRTRRTHQRRLCVRRVRYFARILWSSPFRRKNPLQPLFNPVADLRTLAVSGAGPRAVKCEQDTPSRVHSTALVSPIVTHALDAVRRKYTTTEARSATSTIQTNDIMPAAISLGTSSCM